MRPGELILPALTVAAVAAVLTATHWLLERRFRDNPPKILHKQLVMSGLTLLAIPVVVLSLPLSEHLQGQILGLIGILLSGALALSSTTFLGNALAGILLRAVRSFRSGDYIRVEGHFGRVSGRGLFHVELQTEDRDLTTLPNLFLATHPVKVIRTSGTIVTAEVSLGYDVPRTRIEQLLLEAAADAGLQEPFVLITGLGDFSVVYRTSGLLPEVERLLSARSRLNGCIMDRLHGAGIEIVSPNFMNTRAAGETRYIPRPEAAPSGPPEAAAPEAIVFDKADRAQALEEQRDALHKVEEELAGLEEGLEELAGEERERRERRIAALTAMRDKLTARIARKSEALEEESQ